MYILKIAAKSEIGNIRKENEDCYFVAPNQKAIAIADGMGGHENGKIASYIAIEVFKKHQELADDEFSLEKFAAIIKNINQAVYSYKQNEAMGKMMGTTFSSIIIKGQTMFLAHIGDSRIYLYRDGVLKQLTEDHSYLTEMLRSSQNGGDVLNAEKNKHILTKAIGPEAVVEGQIEQFTLHQGDILLLCTDGLHNGVWDQEIADILAQNTSLNEKMEYLLTLALNRGGHDNITLVLCEYEQEADR